MAARSSATPKSTPEDRLVDAALDEIVKSGWKALSLAALASKAKIPARTLYELCPDKRALLALISRRIDIALLEKSLPPDPAASMRDRAFDAILNWFENMAPMRPALSVIRDEGASDFGTMIDVIPATMRSAHWIADTAALPTTGWQGFLVTRGIGVLLAETVGIWLSDGPELERTMAHVDRRLRTFEEWSESFQRATSSAGKNDEDETDRDFS